MKNQIIKKYLVRIIIYTAAYGAAVLAMDFLFNGVVIDYLYDLLPEKFFYLIWQDKAVSALIVYIAGLVVVSVLYIFRLAGLLNTAGNAVITELPEDSKIPEELREFTDKLKEFKQTVKENEEARKAAEQQKNDLIVYLAHDLKTPLTSVIGYLSLLEEAPDIPVEQRSKYTGIALDKAYRLEYLINEFFEITRLNLQTSSVKKVWTNLTVLLLQVISEFYPMLEEKGMTVTQSISNDLKVMGDPDQLARVFENLLRNAVNYGRAGTAIECTAYAANNQAVIKVVNEGDEIPPEKLGHIFDKFYRLDDARQSKTGGTGLGLAIAKQIVELHGGRITAVSNGGVTGFTVILPL